MNKLGLLTAVMTTGILACGYVSADTVPANINITATVSSYCTFSGETIDFNLRLVNSYQKSQAFVIACTAATLLDSVTLSMGDNADADGRRLKNDDVTVLDSYIPYQISIGNTESTAADTELKTELVKNSNDYEGNIVVNIPEAIQARDIGTYSDVVVMTISYHLDVPY